MTPRHAPRLLARRALAFVVDHTLAVLVVIALTLPLAGWGLRPPAPLLFLRTERCQPLEAAPDWLALRTGGAEVLILRLCERVLLGLPDGRDLLAVLDPLPQPQAPRAARYIRQPVDRALTPVPALEGLSALAVWVLLGVTSALLTARGWRSPGKALFRLQLVAEGRPRPWRREVLRLGPLALPAAISLAAAQGLIPPPPVWPLGVAVGLAALASLAALWFYVLPLVRWTGQARHDRLSGYRVLRKG